MNTVKMKYILLMLFGVQCLKHNSDGTILQIGKATKGNGPKQKAKNIFKPSHFNAIQEETGIPTALVNPLGFTTDDFDVVQAIYNQNNGTQAAGDVTASISDEPIVLGLRSGFQNVLDTIDITKSTSKNRQGQMCKELSEVMTSNTELHPSIGNYGFAASCNRQNYKNSGCYVKCQKGYELVSKKPLVTCRCRKRNGAEEGYSCRWDGLADMRCESNEIEDLSNLGRSNMEETERKCERPTNQGVLTVLDTWSNGLMGMLSTSVSGNLSDWTMVIEWNKPVKSRKSFLWNAKLSSVSKDLTLWTITNKNQLGRDPKNSSKVKFGMVIDKIERRDYEIDDLTANVYFWNYNYPDASCWGSDIGSTKNLLSTHIDEITRTRLHIQPENSEKYCYYGKYENTNIWKHSEKIWKVQGHISFDLPVPLAEWEVQLVWDEGKKMAVAETPQMVKTDRSRDGIFWSFKSQTYNKVLFNAKEKFFIQGSMWRSAPGPKTGAVRICGMTADWATQQSQRSQIFSEPKYTGECSVNEQVSEYDFKIEERCQNWSPTAINHISKPNIRKWNRSSGCEKLPNDQRLICLSILYIDGQRAGFNATNIPYRTSSTLKDGCDLTDRFNAPTPRDLSGGFFANDGHLKVTQVTSNMVTMIAWSLASNFEIWETKGLSEWAIGTVKHGLEWLVEARTSGADIVTQVGDARTDSRCDISIDNLDENRPTIVSTRKAPATDTLGGFVAAVYASAHAFSIAGDKVEAKKCARKAENVLEIMFSGPKGLSGENPDYEPGVIAPEWSGGCYQDEMAWASAWACLGSEGMDECFDKVATLLDSAEEVCGESEFKWGWNDVRLGTRILLAQYGSKKSHANILERQLDGIMKYDLKEICQVPEHATSLANLFVMATQLKTKSSSTWSKFASRLIGCSAKNVIGISDVPDVETVQHKNSRYYGATLWGGLLDKKKHTSLLNSVNLLLSAVLHQ